MNRTNLNIFRLKNESLEDMVNFPDPNIHACDIAENLKDVFSQFNNIYENFLRDNNELKYETQNI